MSSLPTPAPEGDSPVPPARHQTGLITIVFTDLVGSTALKQQVGDRTGASLIQQHHGLVRELLQAFPGAEEIETAGDSFLIVFSKPSDAVHFGLLLHARLRALSQRLAAKLEDRIGIHVGEVVIREQGGSPNPKGLTGLQVDTCARVMGLAQGGQILLTRSAFDSARQMFKGEDIPGVGPMEWLNHGSYMLKGIEGVLEVCEVGELGIAPLQAPAGSEKAQRQVTPESEPVLGWRPAVGQFVPNTRWQLETKLGEGGFGEVWLGRNSTTKQARVFKFCFQAERVRFLKREMTLLRVLKERVGDHPNIVRLNDVYLDQPPFYVEMEHVQGADLRSWCQEYGGVAAIPLETRLEIVAQVADGLQAAHEAGIIHRDVKPANILIGGKGVGPTEVQVKLTDFGIGQVVSDEYLQGITRAGFTQTILSDSSSSHTGTQLYMAPELVVGKPASTRSDIYSLGVVLYQLLVGDFSRPVTTDWVKQIPDSLLREDITRCFAGDPNDRFGSAAELAKNLRALAERRAALERQEAELAARERAAYWRGVMRTTSAGAVVVVVIAGLALAAVRTAMDRRRQLYVSDMAVAWQALQDQQASRAWELVGRYLHRQPWEEDLRGFEWRLLWQRSRPNFENSLDQHGDRVTCVIFSPDGKLLATAGHDRTVMVWDLKRRRCLRTLKGFDDFIDLKALAFSPDGKLVAAKGGKRLRIWRTDNWQEVTAPLEVEPNWNNNNAIVFSPDGSALVTRVPGGLGFFDTASWQSKEKLPGNHTEAGFGTLGTVLVYSSDGQFLAVSDWTELQIRDAHQPLSVITNLTLVPRDGNRVLSVAISDSLVGAGYREGMLGLWERATWKQVALLRVSQSFLVALAFSPDGSLLAAAGNGHVIQVWEVKTLLAAQARTEAIRPKITFRGHEAQINAVTFSPDGRGLVSASDEGTVKFWNVFEAADHPNLLGSTEPLGFSSNGKVFGAFHNDGRLHLWDVQKQRDLGAMGAVIKTNDIKVALSKAGQELAFSLTNGEVQLWHVLPPALERRLTGDGHPVRALDLSPEPEPRHLLVVSGGGTEYNYRLYDLLDATSPLLLKSESVSPIWPEGDPFAFSSDGKLLAVLESNRGLTLFDTKQGGSRRLGADSENFGNVAFSPDGSLLATGMKHQPFVWIWDVKSGQRRLRLKLPERNSGLAFSPDGKTLVTWDFDNMSRFWSAALHKEILRVVNFNPARFGVWFSPRDDALALRASKVTSASGEIELYSLPSLKEIDAQKGAKGQETLQLWRSSDQ